MAITGEKICYSLYQDIRSEDIKYLFSKDTKITCEYDFDDYIRVYKKDIFEIIISGREIKYTEYYNKNKNKNLPIGQTFNYTPKLNNKKDYINAIKTIMKERTKIFRKEKLQNLLNEKCN